MKILVADDAADFRALLSAVLTAWQYDVVCAATGDDALSHLTAPGGPRLAILDWEMPGIDGPTVCRRVRERDHHDSAYLMLLTGRRDPTDIAEGLDSGADDYVAKPFDPLELRARLKVGSRVLELQAALASQQRLHGAMELAGAVCHELNQPIQVLSAWSELLAADLDENDARQAPLARIKQATDRVGQLTRKLAGLTRYAVKDYMAGASRILDLENSAAPDRALEKKMTDRKILVVDDEPNIRDVFVETLGRVGYEVKRRRERRGWRWRSCGRQPSWLLFLDLNLPGMNGLELCRAIRAEWPMTIAYAVTGYASLFELSDCRAAGFEDYFTKPVALNTLRGAAERGFEKLDRWKSRANIP